jgi:hypothetical protein
VDVVPFSAAGLTAGSFTFGVVEQSPCFGNQVLALGEGEFGVGLELGGDRLALRLFLTGGNSPLSLH